MSTLFEEFLYFMSFVYRSRIVGLHGKEFDMFKIRTLVPNSDKDSFVTKETYTKYGRLLRRFKADEFLQFYNVLKGDMALFGWRPLEPRGMRVLPLDVRDKLFTTKPGVIDIASLYFYDEEKMLAKSLDPH